MVEFGRFFCNLIWEIHCKSSIVLPHWWNDVNTKQYEISIPLYIWSLLGCLAFRRWAAPVITIEEPHAKLHSQDGSRFDLFYLRDLLGIILLCRKIRFRKMVGASLLIELSGIGALASQCKELPFMSLMCLSGN